MIIVIIIIIIIIISISEDTRETTLLFNAVACPWLFRKGMQSPSKTR